MKILVTGGAGFIGSNIASRGIRLGHEVVVLDNLSRRGSSWNLDWLKSLGNLEFINVDIRDSSAIQNLFNSQEFEAVIHQAGQVAVTVSVQDPRADFEINALGTLNLLEAIRLSKQNPVFVYASTNKVYGSLSPYKIYERDGQYVFEDLPNGISETVPLEFYSPYGCSKGSADQYVLDYRRIFGLKTFVFRQSCIYGPRQMGVEDQGWVAWFALCAVLGKPISIFGDGMQVRDVLYIDDLVDLYFSAIETDLELGSSVFNVGGGNEQAVSLLEVIQLLEEELRVSIDLEFSEWRPGDQKVYVSDIGALSGTFNWSPKVKPASGISSLLKWISQNLDAIQNRR